MYVMLPLMVRFELLTVAVGHWLSSIEALSLTQDEVMVHVPAMAPPQAAVLLHVPPELPHPCTATAANNPATDITLIILIARSSDDTRTGTSGLCPRCQR